MSARVILYLSRSSPLCQVTTWLTRAVEVSYDERTVSSDLDMADIIERNPNKSLPVLHDGDLFLTEGSAVLKYIVELAKQQKSGGRWPALAGGLTFKENAKVEEMLSYGQSIVKTSIKDYLQCQQNAVCDTVPDSSKVNRVNAVLAELEMKKKGHHFLTCSHVTIADLFIYASIYPLCSRPSFKWKKMAHLEGWFRVMGKVVTNEWSDESSCLDAYDSDSDTEDYLLAETIMDCVKNDRPDILDQLAKDGGNINMPLAVVEAVNRGNLSILKVMRDHDCFLKWPMAITMALKFSKSEEILALLFGPGQTPEERKKEAEEILKQENKKMREALGLPPEEEKKDTGPQVPQVPGAHVRPGTGMPPMTAAQAGIPQMPTGGPVQQVPGQPLPGQPLPTGGAVQQVPGQPLPTGGPIQHVPGQPLPGQPVSTTAAVPKQDSTQSS